MIRMEKEAWAFALSIMFGALVLYWGIDWLFS